MDDATVKSGVNAICATCVRDCKQSPQVVLHSCAKYSQQLTLDDELRAFNRRRGRKTHPKRLREEDRRR